MQNEKCNQKAAGYAYWKSSDIYNNIGTLSFERPETVLNKFIQHVNLFKRSSKDDPFY